MRRTSRRSSRTSLRGLRPRLRHGFRPAVLGLEDRTLLSTVTWINPGGGDWDTPSNWSTDALPGPADDVVISMPGITVTHSSSAPDSVNSLTITSNRSALDISDGSLAFNTTSSIAGSLTLSNASLGVAGDLTVSGPMAWTGGTIAGGGTLSAQGGLALGSSGDEVTETLDGVALDNAGAASFSGSEGMALQGGAGIDNQPGGRFTFLTTAYFSSDATATYFKNEGSLTVAEPAGDYAEIAPAFTQTGTGPPWSGRANWT